MQDTVTFPSGQAGHVQQILKPTVAVVVCTRNRPALLRNCLGGISRLNPAPAEVIVVDNTAGDKDTEALALEFSARYITEPAAGLSRARNRGIRECSSEVVAFIDDDAVPEKRWLEFLVEPFADARVAVVTGEAIPPGSKAEPEPGIPRSLDNRNQQWFEKAAYGGLGIGTNMALRKAPCADLQVFDERLGRGAPLHGMEEFYAFLNLLSRDYSAVHIPAAVVIHPYVRRYSVEQEASCLIAYWLVLFSDFPGHRRDLLSFLFRRLKRKPLDWQRNSPDAGQVVTSGWRVLSKALLRGMFLYFRARKPKT